MKRILLYILLILTVLLAAACDAFFLPPFERTNPYDDGAPVAPVTSFQAKTIDANTIELSWTLPEDRAPSSLLIVRNSNAQPATVDDGTIINGSQLVPAADGVFTDTEVSEGSSYYYGVWSAHGETDASLEDYTFVGPVYDSTGTTFNEVNLTPTLDGWVNDMPNSNYATNTLIISWSGNDYNSLVQFGIPDIVIPISTATLVLECIYTATGGDTLHIAPITQPWTTSIDYSTTNQDTFVDLNYNVDVTINDGFTGQVTADVTSLVQEWLNANSFYGIRLKGDYAGGGDLTEFESSEGTIPPNLTIIYYD